MLVENELNKLQTFDSSYFIGKNHFEEEGTQNYLVFQPMYRYFKAFSIIQYVEYVSDENLKDYLMKVLRRLLRLITTLSYHDIKIRVKFNGGCLKQPKISYTHGTIVNIYIVYELGASSSSNNDPTLKDCLFGAVTLTKNADIDKCGYPGYGIGFNKRSSLHFEVVDLVKMY